MTQNTYFPPWVVALAALVSSIHRSSTGGEMHGAMDEHTDG